MAALTRIVLTLLPKTLLSWTARGLASIPLPGFLRAPVHRTYAALTGADVAEAAGSLRDYPTLRAFFQRPLRPGLRPIADASLVWPCDGRIASSGPLRGDLIPQVKGWDYTLAQLLQDEALAAVLRGGSQCTIYLAPADYHRVHAPFAADVLATRAIPGTLYPVNGPAVRSVPGLFARNARVVFTCRLRDGRIAALVMVAALMVTDTTVTCAVPGAVAAGEEIGRFGFGSTVVLLLPPGAQPLPELPAGTGVRLGRPIGA